jgi:hypothetical protein
MSGEIWYTPDSDSVLLTETEARKQLTIVPDIPPNRLSAESMARSLTVISLLFHSKTHCRYRLYTKFLLTYTAIYRRNLKVLLLGITALQPQSHFHLGTPYNYCH